MNQSKTEANGERLVVVTLILEAFGQEIIRSLEEEIRRWFKTDKFNKCR